ncbi:hypothetical protein GY45DRAFT_1265020 [Cubamyces sp. BRFM 1775]|nr:hypothetical protein GY45DRAFT_1265020 [Cubamyces sp. BRFM 1775]
MVLVNYGWLIGQIPLLLQQPIGIYGISYDIYTRPTEDPVPGGWHSRGARTYRELIRQLARFGFHQHQYSDYRCPNTQALHAVFSAFNAVKVVADNLNLMAMPGLKVHYISDLNLLDVTRHVKLGGNVARRLAGPAPHQLAQQLELQAGQNLSAPFQPVPPGHPGVPPFATRRNQQTLNVANYWM